MVKKSREEIGYSAEDLEVLAELAAGMVREAQETMRDTRLQVYTTPGLAERLRAQAELYGWPVSYAGHVALLIGVSALEADAEAARLRSDEGEEPPL